MELTKVKELLSTKEHQAFHTVSEINAYIFYKIKSGLPILGPLEIRTSSIDEAVLEEGLTCEPFLSENDRAAILDSRVSLAYEILKSEICRLRSAVGPLLEEYISCSCDAEEDYYFLPSPLIVDICDYLDNEDPSFEANKYIPAFDKDKHSSIVVDMTAYRDARFIFSHQARLVDSAFSTYNRAGREARLFFMYKGGQRWDEKEARHFMHMHRYLSDIFEVGNLILLEYKKRILGGPFIKTVKLHYPEKDMMFEVDANIAHPSSRPRMYYLAGLNGSGYNSTFELAPERVLLPAECYACQVEVNHKLRQGESWMAWDGPRSSGTPYLLKVRNNGMATGERAVTGPVIIVNLDSYRAFAYLEGEIPYLLDDNERAFIVSLRMSINRLSKSMNDRLPKMFYDIEHDRKLTPQGKRYHLTEGEKIYIILHGDEELTKRMSRKPIGDNRFGYDDTTWNNIIEKEDKVNAFIKALNAERDTKTDKPIIRVEECGDGNFRLTRNMSKRDATLFVYLISCILGIWDFSNHDDHVAPPVVDHDLSACDRGFDNNNSMCSSYFDVRLSLPKDTIRKNRKYAMRCFDEERKGLAGDVLSDRVKNIFDLVKKAAVKMI